MPLPKLKASKRFSKANMMASAKQPYTVLVEGRPISIGKFSGVGDLLKPPGENKDILP